MKTYITNRKTAFTIVCMLCLCFSSVAIAQEDEAVGDKQLIYLSYPNSLAELIGQFEGQVIYIDVMASWCQPCIKELDAYKEMDDFFAEHNIVKLFISIDPPKDHRKCIDLINSYNIDGYFTSYLAPEEQMTGTFAQEIGPYFFSLSDDGQINISIPRYVIVDKQGEFVETKAKRPSQAALKKQLLRYADK